MKISRKQHSPKMRGLKNRRPCCSKEEQLANEAIDDGEEERLEVPPARSDEELASGEFDQEEEAMLLKELDADDLETIALHKENARTTGRHWMEYLRFVVCFDKKLLENGTWVKAAGDRSQFYKDITNERSI